MKKTALLIITAIALTGLCGCGSKPAAENYFGGEGELKAEDFLIYDENNIYINLGSTVKKYNKNANTLTVACETPGCGHGYDDVECKARMKYCLFNGSLIRIYNETVENSDSTFTTQGYLYLCGDSEKQVFKNVLPEGIDSERKDPSIGYVFSPGDDYLVLDNGSYMYILDTDLEIKYTVIGVGPRAGSVYYVDNEIYYIDNLYRLRKLDMESGAPSLVDLGGMNMVDGVLEGDVLWFSDDAFTLCSYNFKTGEITEHAQNNSVRLARVGKYIEYMVYDAGDVYLYDTESGADIRREDIDISEDELFFLNGAYYRYNVTKDELTVYEDDLTTVIKTCALSE